MPTFTVFTPTFNRAHTLPRVYESLRRQSCRDFEWLIVDDGSTDGTAVLVEQWQRANEFPIRYHRQENRGKHIATNVGVTMARGELFASIDSDDEIAPNGLAIFRDAWNSIPVADRSSYAGVWGLCVAENGELVGDQYPIDPMPSSYSEMRHRWRIRGEKWSIQRTDILRQYPFPALAGNNVPEAFVFMQIDKRYRSLFVNDVVRVYWSVNLRDDQMSTRKRPWERAQGGAFWHAFMLSHQLHWFGADPVWFLRSAVHYSRFSWHSGDNLRIQWRGLSGWMPRLLWLMALIPGTAVYFRDKLLYEHVRLTSGQ